MPSLSAQERLQPALLDRLIDDEPERQVEARESRLITVRKLREAVLRDLAWLFNASAHFGQEIDRSLYPHAHDSTLTFGLPPLAGNMASSIDGATLEASIRDAVIRFEPRLVPGTLRVKAMLAGKSLDHHNQIQVEIRGSLWSVPVPIEMLLHTEVDLESGQVEVREAG